jgi:hypothetical protein
MRSACWLRLLQRSLLLLLLARLLLLLLLWWHASCRRRRVAWPWLRPRCSSWHAVRWHVRQPCMVLLPLLLQSWHSSPWQGRLLLPLLRWRHLLAPARNHVLLLLPQRRLLHHPWHPRTWPG